MPDTYASTSLLQKKLTNQRAGGLIDQLNQEQNSEVYREEVHNGLTHIS